MKSILTESEFQTWRDDTEQYETYPDLTVDTKIGKIYAKTVPGSFPGILIECETSNTAGSPGALLEYDETKKKNDASCVWNTKSLWKSYREL